MDDEIEVNKAMLFDVAILGEQVDAFMRSDVGKYLVDKANRELNAALKGLKTVNPAKMQDVQKFQNEVWRAENLITWLSESVMAGLKAKDILEERDE